MTPLSKAAQAIAGVLYPGMSWTFLTKEDQDECYKAARECLRSVIDPVSDEVVEAACDVFFYPGHQADESEKTATREAITAAIRSIIGEE